MVGEYEFEVAEALTKVFVVPSVLHEVPLLVETWKVTVPVGVTPETPEIVTAAVTDPPRIIGLVGFRVGTGTVGLALFTVRVAALLVLVL